MRLGPGRWDRPRGEEQIDERRQEGFNRYHRADRHQAGVGPRSDVRGTEHFPSLSEAERAELVGGILRELLTRSLIALASVPDQGRSRRPLSPADARMQRSSSAEVKRNESAKGRPP